MRKRKIVIGGSIILALLAARLSVVFIRPARPLAVAVAFAGYTNDMKGERVANFTISNNSRMPILRWNRYQIETPEQAQTGPLVFQGQNVVLDSGQSEVLLIPVPSNQQSWRVVFTCTPYGVRQDFADWANRSGNWRYLPKTLRGVPAQSAKSNWIKE
jgi:hypothetical protein